MKTKKTLAPQRASTETAKQISSMASKLANIKATNPEAFWAIYAIVTSVEKTSTKILTGGNG